MQDRLPQVFFATTAALGTAILMALGLVLIAKPADFDRRLDAVQEDLDRVARTLKHGSDAPALPAGAVCALAPQQAAAKLRADVTAMTTAAHFEHAAVEVAPEAQGGSALVPLRVRLEATGPYEAAAGALQSLSDLRPLLIIDTVDLVSNVSTAKISIVGRVYCSDRH
jgi:hypothetical protein